MSDPTKIDMVGVGDHEATTRLIRGTTNHKGIYFEAPFVTPVADNLWQGGCENRLPLPPFFKSVLSLYKWEAYARSDDVEFREVTMYDSLDGVDGELAFELADWVIERRKEGPVLVHCQAGLNRSALVTVLVLMKDDGMTARAAIDHLRENRSEAVLCNPSFEQWLLALDAADV